MKLNLDIIADYLPPEYKVKRFGPQRRQLLYEPPTLFEEGDTIIPDRIFLGRTASFPEQLPQHTAIICMGMPPQQRWLQTNAQILYIEHRTDVVHSLREINAIYSRFDAWERKLRDVLEDDMGLDIEAMLRLWGNCFKNRLSISGYDLQLLFVFYPAENVLLQPGSNPSQIPSVIPLEQLEMIKQYSRLERRILTPYLSQHKDGIYHSYCQNIYSNYDHYLGCIAANDTVIPFRESDYPLMDLYFGYLRKIYIRYMTVIQTEEADGQSMVEHLVKGTPLSPNEKRLLAADKDTALYCFFLTENASEQFLLKDYMCRAMTTLMPGSVFPIIHHGNIMGLIRTGTQHPEEDLYHSLDKICRRMGYLCGVSSAFTNPEETPVYMQQASFAVSCLDRKKPAASISLFGEHRLAFMLQRCTGDLPAVSLLPKGLQTLQNIDSRKETEYIRTLDTWLRNECNSSRSAELLSLHRNGFLKRMERIRQILNLDLEDPDVRLYLRICLKLID